MGLVEKIWRGARKLASGVPLGGERVWEGVATDLFVAHLSIYRFFAEHASNKRALDAGCGLGYGTSLLAESGAQSVLGIDNDPRAISYARRRYRRMNLEFEVADCEKLVLEPATYDLVVSSNMLEHLRDPSAFLRAAVHGLSAGGVMMIAVPPNNTMNTRAANERNPFHESDLDVNGWVRLFENTGLQVRSFRHFHPKMEALNFGASRPSQFKASEFQFVETDPRVLAESVTVTAIFVLTDHTDLTDQNS